MVRASRIGGDDTTLLLREAMFLAQSYALAEFAHELKNIVQRILTPMRSLSRRLSTEEKRNVSGPMRDLRGGTKALKEFCENLRWLSEGRELSFTRTDVRSVVDDAVSALPGTEQRRVRVPSAPSIPVDVVHERLVRAVTNIVRNGLEASPPGSVVIVDGFLVGEDEAVIRVTDQGPGIPEDQTAEIFQLGRTSKRNTGHHGVGLYMAQRIVEAEHGGEISVSTGPQGGAVFELMVPLRAQVRRHP